MNVVVLPIELHKLRLKVTTDALEDRPQGVKYGFREDVPTVFCDKDQMNV